MKHIFFSIKNDYFKIITENIISVIVDEKKYFKNMFKSMSDFYNFLERNRFLITYIKYIEKSDLYTLIDHVIIIEMYLKNTDKHRLDGPAYIETKNKKNISGLTPLKKIEKYFINNIEIRPENFKKHNEVRKAKIKRIIK